MNRVARTSRIIPTPDRVEFDWEDFIPVDLCAYCVLNLNASHCIRVGNLNTGLARAVEGCEIKLPNGNTFTQFKSGMEIPPGSGWIPMLVGVFGRDITFTDGSGAPVDMFPITTRNGTLLCERCNSSDHLLGKK